MMPHLPPQIPRILLTGRDQFDKSLVEEEEEMDKWILLPAPIPVSEADSFGVAAPTTSTTVALALTDALAISTARVLHTDPSRAFKRNHPGGAIGKGG